MPACRTCCPPMWLAASGSSSPPRCRWHGRSSNPPGLSWNAMMSARRRANGSSRYTVCPANSACTSQPGCFKIAIVTGQIDESGKDSMARGLAVSPAVYFSAVQMCQVRDFARHKSCAIQNSKVQKAMLPMSRRAKMKRGGPQCGCRGRGPRARCLGRLCLVPRREGMRPRPLASVVGGAVLHLTRCVAPVIQS